MAREREMERLAQVKAMREQVTRFTDAKAKGDNAGLMRVKLALSDIVEKFMKDMDKDEKEDWLPTWSRRGKARRMPL